MITPNNPPKLPCPICGRGTPISDAKYLPFCSERCRLIDLGRWLDEEHALPATPTDDDDDDSGGESTDSPSPRLPPGWHDA